MKQYSTPELKLLPLSAKDVITTSATTVSWNATDGEYMVAGASEWWT